MDKNMNKYESIKDYFGESCIYATWNDANRTEINLLTLEGEYARPYGNLIIEDDDIANWEPSKPGQDIINEIKEWFRNMKDNHASDDDYTSEDVDNAIAFFWHKNDNQYILVLAR